jgi:transposase
MKNTQSPTLEQSEAASIILMLRNEIICLKEQNEWLRKQLFGKKSEKERPLPSNGNQLTLFDFGVLMDDQPQITEQQFETIPEHKRRKPNRNGQDKMTFPPDLPVKKVVLDIPEEAKICPVTGQPLIKIGEEVTQKLVHIPDSFYIKEYIRPKYASPKQEEVGILIAEMPDSVIPKCKADESLLAEIIVKKFSDHLPLYRISEIFARQDVHISRKLLSQWVVRCGMALRPLYNEMLNRILASGNIFVDESPVDIIQAGEVKTGYMWVVAGGKESDPQSRAYVFRDNRRHENVPEILNGYDQVLHSDKYGAYEVLANKKLIKWCPCWAHIRRKFFEAESGDPEFRKWVLRKIRYLFMLERVAWERPLEERLRIRQEKEIPIIDELIDKIKKKLLDGRLLPKSKLREALGYFCGLIPHLKTYTLYPYARLDNNVAERAIRPLAIGRKNWLFFGSEDGGIAGAVLLSLVQTCRGLGIDPREYLDDVLRRIMGHNSQKLYELLPDQWLLNKKKMQNNS